VATDDIKVGLKVTLDEESMAREVQKAEARVNKKGSASGSPGGGSQSGASLAEALKISVTKPIVDKLAKIEEKLTRAGASAQMAGGIAQVLMVLKILDAMYQAIKAVLSSIWNLTQSLSRFSPVLSVAFRQLAILLRMLSIDLGRLIGNELANLVNFIKELVAFLYAIFRADIKILAVLFSLLIDALRVALDVIRYVFSKLLWLSGKIYDVVGDVLLWIAQYVPGTIGTMLLELGAVTKTVAGEILKHAELVKNSSQAGKNAVQQMNSALISGFSFMGQQGYQGVTAPGQGDEREAPKWVPPLKSEGNVRQYKNVPSNSVATGRKAVNMQTPQMASVVNNVQLNAEVKLQHEEAVQRAIEEIRGCLVKAIHGVRNEQILLSSKIYARTVIDL